MELLNEITIPKLTEDYICSIVRGEKPLPKHMDWKQFLLSPQVKEPVLSTLAWINPKCAILNPNISLKNYQPLFTLWQVYTKPYTFFHTYGSHIVLSDFCQLILMNQFCTFQQMQDTLPQFLQIFFQYISFEKYCNTLSSYPRATNGVWHTSQKIFEACSQFDHIIKQNNLWSKLAISMKYEWTKNILAEAQK